MARKCFKDGDTVNYSYMSNMVLTICKLLKEKKKEEDICGVIKMHNIERSNSKSLNKVINSEEELILIKVRLS